MFISVSFPKPPSHIGMKLKVERFDLFPEFFYLFLKVVGFVVFKPKLGCVGEVYKKIIAKISTIPVEPTNSRF